MEFCHVVRVGPDRSIPLDSTVADALGFHNGAVAHFYLIQSEYYVGQSERKVEFTLLASCLQPDIWGRLYDLEFRLGDDPGAFATLARILADLGIAIQLSEARTKLMGVRTAVSMTAWFQRYEGTIRDLNQELTRRATEDAHLRTHLKPVHVDGDTEVWVRGLPSALQSLVFKRQFAPGTAGKAGTDTPIILPPRDTMDEVREGALRVPPSVVDMLDKRFGLPDNGHKSIAGGGFGIINADTDTKILSITFPSPKAQVVKAAFHVVDSLGVLAELGEELQKHNVNLLESKVVTLEFSRHAVWYVIADISESRFSQMTRSEFEQELQKTLRKRQVPLFGPQPVAILEMLGGYRNQPAYVQAFSILSALERDLRDFIADSLEEVAGTDWWKSRVPPDVRENAEARMGADELPPDQSPEARAPMEFVDFASYAQIILRKENWSQCFETAFDSRDALKTKLHELEPIRNSVAHGRNVTDDDVSRLVLYAADLQKAIEEGRKQRASVPE